MDTTHCRVGNTQYRMIVSNPSERIRVDTLETKEPETVQWILDQFRPGDTLYDIGANIGIFAILAAAWNPRGTVVAVEPMPASFTRLCENGALNDLTNLRPYCVAIAAENGLGMMNLVSLAPSSSMHSLGDSDMTAQFGEPVVLRTGIGLATIDALARAAGPPSLIKIDVDGGEDDVLAGAAATLHHPSLRSVLIEFNWVEGTTRKEGRDEPLLRAGFVPRATGAEYGRYDVRWQNTIYTRGTS
ncbi:MAG TPA: FkbM family methyltransferase [Thermoanaerobaculia bacterium]|nr:FkbM family methyltransferase [Thermoanaerobaculia bacterium]